MEGKERCYSLKNKKNCERFCTAAKNKVGKKNYKWIL
jgi:hypothetical protein